VIRLSVLAATTFSVLTPATALAQNRPPDVRSTDSVTIAIGAHYRASGLHRFLVGGTYRDLWMTPIRVPVLNLQTFEGGLTPGKAGGGFETKSLRFTTPDGVEYVFRSADKDNVDLPADLHDVGLLRRIALDQVSSSHPAASIVTGALLEAAGVLHDAPVLVAMPDDAILGKYRKLFAHRVGMLQVYPGKTKGDVPMFANAIDIIDSDTLLQLLNRDPAEQVDAPAFLAARLMDMLVNNWDRHPGQWKWARLQPAPTGLWEPISRDYDKSFISATGFLIDILRKGTPNQVTFDSTYPGLRGLTWGSLDLDRRLLAGLAKPQWDSVARALAKRITDSAIDAAIGVMPPEYHASVPALAAKLRMRRDSLVPQADRFYRFLADVVDIHATDAAERATITRVDDRYVDVRLAAGDGPPYFFRRFDAHETSEIRIYLHGGDDEAQVVGDVGSSIPLRIIGGNGTNRLVDSSRVGGRHDVAHLYDEGVVQHTSYLPDTLFNRRPLVSAFGGLFVPGRDYGEGLTPIVDLTLNHDVGIMPSLGMTWHRYGFRDDPYSSMVSLEGSYSSLINGSRFALKADQRGESSPLHLTEWAQVSQLELVNYHGLGNSSPQSAGLISGVTAPRSDYYAVNQRQWLLQPALALALSETTALSFGPVLKYFVTDSLADRFVSATLPYGSGQFGEAGLRIGLSHNGRVPPQHTQSGTAFDLSASYFPSLWDVRSGFGVVNASGAVYVTIPVPLRPYFGLRGGAKQLFGDFPFEEAAFLGGRNDVRTLDQQRYAGDASLYATAELRIPVAKFTILLPLNTGLLATEDVGRVYVKGESPGGWHNAFGTGFWIGFHELLLDVRVMQANEVGRPAIIAFRFAVPSVVQ
jgi:hypothetical protein